jgi:hypothetical protein
LFQLLPLLFADKRRFPHLFAAEELRCFLSEANRLNKRLQSSRYFARRKFFCLASIARSIEYQICTNFSLSKHFTSLFELPLFCRPRPTLISYACSKRFSPPRFALIFWVVYKQLSVLLSEKTSSTLTAFSPSPRYRSVADKPKQTLPSRANCTFSVLQALLTVWSVSVKDEPIRGDLVRPFPRSVLDLQYQICLSVVLFQIGCSGRVDALIHDFAAVQA